MKKRVLFIIFLFICIALPAQSARTIRIFFSKTYQTIDFFSASDCWSMQKIGEWDTEQKERVADLLFSTTKGIGLSGWRFNTGAGINHTTISHPWRTVETFEVSQGQYDWTRQEEERWFLQAAQERGVTEFVAFVNSPPARITQNGYTNCTDKLGSTNLKPGNESQFATYLTDILKHFQDDWDIHFDYISPVNEPQWEWNNGCNQEGNRASNADIINIVDALYDELQNQGMDTEISLVESGDLRSWYQLNSQMTSEYGTKYGNYIDELIKNQSIANKISKHFCGHSYSSDRLQGQLTEDRNAAKSYFNALFDLGWKYWASEYCILDGPEGAGGHGRDLSIKTALDVARIIHFDLVILDASSWSWWTAMSPEDYKDGLLYTNYKNNPSSQSIYESKTLWAYGNFSRYIRPGATRIKVTGANNKEELMCSAFLNKDSDQLILVFVNVSQDEIPVNLQFLELPSNQTTETITPFVTTDKTGDDLKEYPAFSSDSAYTVPARSVVTLVAEIKEISTLEKSKSQEPQMIKLGTCYPNPFNHMVRINFQLYKPLDISLNIYNNLGQKVTTLTDGTHMTGSFEVSWDATNQNGDSISSGIYFCALESDLYTETRKMVLVQ